MDADDLDYLESLVLRGMDNPHFREFHGSSGQDWTSEKRSKKYVNRIKKAYARDLGVDLAPLEADVLQEYSHLAPQDWSDPIVRIMLESVLETKPFRDVPVPVDTPVRATWTGRFNAVTIRLPSGRPAIVFDQAAVIITRTVAKAFDDWWAEVVEQKAGRRQARRAYYRSLVILANVLQHLRTDNMQYLRRSQEHYVEAMKTSRYRMSAEAMSRAMQNFVLAHELGHVALGHTSGRGAFNLSPLGPGKVEEQVETLNYRHGLEHAADKYAADFLLSEVHGWSMVASFMEILVQGQSASATQSVTHPSWLDRWTRLAQHRPFELVEATDALINVTRAMCQEANEIAAAWPLQSVNPQNLHHFYRPRASGAR